MEDLVALGKARIVCCTSSDPAHPPLNILDGNENTYWISTGMFPQELLIEFSDGLYSLSRAKTFTTGVRRISIEGSSESSSSDFSLLLDVELSNADQYSNGPQIESFQLDSKTKVKYLRVTLHSGWGDFATVSRIILEGKRV